MTASSPQLPPAALQSRSRETADRIVTAGMDLLRTGGAEALTVASVAREAGVAVGSVYRRFGDKERLLVAIQVRFTDDFVAEFARRVGDGDLSADSLPEEVIGAAVAGVASTFAEHADLLRVFLLLGTQNRAVWELGARVSVAGGRVFRDTVMLAAPALRHHADVELAIDFAHRMTYGVCAHRLINGEQMESARPLPFPGLIRELSAAVCGYLLSGGSVPAAD